jgi:serine/threonine protein kinase
VAPEQIRGTSVLGLADQYSLGCVLYECLTGRVPFEKDLDAAIIWAHVEETPTMPTVLRSDLPPEIDEVFGRVLSKRAIERYGSCREFIDAARIALGIFGRGTDSLAYGLTTTGLDASAPPGRHAGAPPERYSWSSPPAHGVRGQPRRARRPRRRIAIRAWPVLEQPAERRSSRPRAARCGSARRRDLHP